MPPTPRTSCRTSSSSSPNPTARCGRSSRSEHGSFASRAIASPVAAAADDAVSLEELLPSADAGPEAAYARSVLLEELDAALNELPPEQREVFIAHELEGVSFRDLAARSGVGLSTLLSRKRYAVLFLRERLREIYDEFTATGD